MSSTLRPTCFICRSVEVNTSIRSSQFGEDELSKNLETIFILRTIFEVPVERIQYYISSLTENRAEINKWGIHLCWSCTGSVDNVKQMYNQMVRSIRVFQEAKQNIIEQLKRSQWDLGREHFNRDHFSEPDQLRKLIVNETRQFVCENDYGEVALRNPFTSGDLLAQKLVQEKRQRGNQQKRTPKPRPRTRIADLNPTSLFHTLHLSTCPDHTSKKPHYRCPVCPKDLTHLAKLKFHVTRYHIEHIFSSAKLPETTEEKFKECCIHLMDSLTDLDTSGPHLKECKATICCTECIKGFTDKRYLHCHWIQHHFPLLCGMLQDLQRNQPVTMTPTAVATKSTDVPKKLINDGSNFKCNQCVGDIYFPNVHELQSHAVNLHPEQFFPEVEFNTFGISSSEYKGWCKLLFKCVNIRKPGNESFGCPFCSNCYVGQVTIKLHLVTSHWDSMAKRLKEILEGKVEEPEAEDSEDEVRVEIQDTMKVENDVMEVIVLEDDVEDTYEQLESYYENETDEDPLAL